MSHATAALGFGDGRCASFWGRPNADWGKDRTRSATPAIDHETMSHIAPNTPPFAPAPTADPRIESWADRHPVLLMAASLGIGLIAAAVIGTSVGMLVYSGSAAGCNTDGWCELGAAIYGLLAGCLAAVVAHIVAGVVFIRRNRPPGQRTLPVVLHIGIPVMLFGFLLALSGH